MSMSKPVVTIIPQLPTKRRVRGARESTAERETAHMTPHTSLSLSLSLALTRLKPSARIEPGTRQGR